MRHLIPLWCWLIVAAALLGGPARVAGGQPLNLIDADTQVRRISFVFQGRSSTFDKEDLLPNIATRGPGFWDRFRRLNPFREPVEYPFDPIELQKDVVRLRRFYAQNGYPAARISYAASQLDTTSNRIHIILGIQEGQPVIIQDVGFQNPEGDHIYTEFDERLREEWFRFRDQLSLRAGDRYTEVERLDIQDRLLEWLQGRGFAFARVDADVATDTLYLAADLTYTITPGPVGTIAAIEVEGATSVGQQVVRRELPFSVGDRYDNRKLRDGQRQLFGLNLFRVALADLPEQPADSTVDVRIRVREAKPRYVTAETGYSRELGIGFNGEWLNRNFVGGARNLTARVSAETGLLGTTGGFTSVNSVGKLPARLFRFSLSLRQPYLVSNRTSAIVSPFVEFRNDPQLPASNRFLDINRGEYGVSSTFIYEILPYRPVTVQHTLSRILQQFSSARASTLSARDLYNQSTLGINATIGWADNYIAPSSGFLARPFIETAGRLFGSGVQYNKAGIELVGYMPATPRLNISGRLFMGSLWPFANSRRGLAGRFCVTDELAAGETRDVARCQTYETRFDPIFFYAGGSSDVRGWDFQLLGDKVARADTLKEDGEVVLDENGVPVFSGFYFERLGGTGKLAGNLEVRTPLGSRRSNWLGAVFLDAGQVANGRFAGRNFKYAAGAGIRYRSLVGFIRLDIAYKLNPSQADLVRPAGAFLFDNGLSTEPPRERFMRRFGLHISIGQAF
ncbi:MAG: BamA/TamA family outer membrane protein [Rhodothermales bacterium]|nr:BamA/TamA family outer membrane protein [Rhodothermales bacterium]